MLYLSRRVSIGIAFAIAVFLVIKYGPSEHGAAIPKTLLPKPRTRHASNSKWRARPQQHPLPPFEP